MIAIYSSQYDTSCIVVEEGDHLDYSIDDVIHAAVDGGATYNDGEDECLVVQLPGRPVELYTERALRGSLRSWR